MKKVILCIIILLFVAGAAGCSRKNIKIAAEDITTNTMVIKKNGSLQVAITEDFDKPYYNYSELQEFIKKEVSAYNDKVGSEEVKINEILIKEKRAVYILSFTGMAHYAAFYNMTAAYFRADTEDVALELPDQYINAKTKAKVDRATAMKDGKTKVLVVYEPYEILVEGSVKFYSENAKISKEGKGILSDEGTTVVIFK